MAISTQLIDVIQLGTVFGKRRQPYDLYLLEMSDERVRHTATHQLEVVIMIVALAGRSMRRKGI